ncbi:hypothetical protein AeMF1_016889 [Aphanomyces euteiches]|nr:hypothetical protein AeMF1_016889 [Aphanomyces euteiches]
MQSTVIADEWRSPEDALAFDTLLLRSVFTRLRRRNIENGILELEFYSNQEVIDELEVHQGKKLIRQRPNLRKLHTRLASLTNIQESVSLDAFLTTRVRDKALSFDMAKNILAELCRTQLEAEAERLRILKLNYKPMWCTRDPKMALRSPATTYNVCFKPPTLLSIREKQQAERVAKWSREKAAVVARLFVEDLLQKLFPPRVRRQGQTKEEAVELTPSRAATPPIRPRKKKAPATITTRSVPREDDPQRLTVMKLQLLCPGLGQDLELPWSLPDANDMEVFVVAAESGGDQLTAARLWSQPHMRETLHKISILARLLSGVVDKAPDKVIQATLWP